MKAVCVKGINSAANHHLLGLTQQLPTHPECRWNTIADRPFILTPIVTATFLSAMQNLYVCVCVCTGVQTYSSPLISTRESWGQSEPRLMSGGESGRDKVGVRQVTRIMLHWCYSTTRPSHHAVTLKGHHPHGTHIDVWDCNISHVCTYAHESGCETVPVSVSWWSFYPFLPHVISFPSRVFLSERPRCDSMFLISERIGTLGEKKKRSKTELPQWSWHLSVLNWCAAVLLGEKQSTRCHCWTLPRQCERWLAKWSRITSTLHPFRKLHFRE